MDEHVIAETSRSVALFGAGGHARVAIDVFRSAGWSIEACIAPGGGADVAGVVVMDEAEAIPFLKDRSVRFAHVAIGDNTTREVIAARAVGAGFELATGVSRHAYVAADVILGPGCLVVHGAVVNVGSRIGAGVIVNTGATVDHDSALGDFVHIAPGSHLAGGVRVGDRGFVGIGTSVIPGMTIGHDAVIGAGSVVVRPVDNSARVWGNRARSHPPAAS